MLKSRRNDSRVSVNCQLITMFAVPARARLRAYEIIED